jgi:hypothetical protein
VDKKSRKRIRDLHARVVGGSTQQEREAAWKKLDAFLREHGKTWNDLPELLHQEQGLHLIRAMMCLLVPTQTSMPSMWSTTSWRLTSI